MCWVAQRASLHSIHVCTDILIFEYATLLIRLGPISFSPLFVFVSWDTHDSSIR